MTSALISLQDLINAVPLLSQGDINDLVAAVLASLGVLYGVFLAQVVIASWSDFEDVRDSADREAAALVDVVRLARAFQLSNVQELTCEALIYGRIVRDKEWRAMAHDKPLFDISRAGDKTLDNLLHIVVTSTVTASDNDAFLSASLDELDELGDARTERFAAYQSHLPSFMWAVLWIGAVVAILLAIIFDVGVHPARAWILALFAGFSLLMIGSIYVWDHPFKEPAAIKPVSFDLAIERIEMLSVSDRGCRVPSFQFWKKVCTAVFAVAAGPSKTGG